MREQWREVVGFPGYQVSDRGRVKSFWKRVGRKGNACGGCEWVIGQEGKVMDWKAHRTGYQVVALTRDRRQFWSPIHILVLEAFVGPRPAGLLGLHRDDDKINNAIENLYWGTRSDNQHDSVRNGHHFA